MTEYKIVESEKEESEQSVFTTSGAQRAITDMGVPEHFYLAPGCYRTAPAVHYDWEFDKDRS